MTSDHSNIRQNMTDGQEDELHIDENSPGDVTASDDSDGETGGNHRKAVQQKKKKMVIYSDEEDQDKEEHTGSANSNDFDINEISGEEDKGSSNSEIEAPATGDLGSNKAPTEALELELPEEPPVAVNVEKRSTRTRKRIQMNGCEC